MMNDEFPEALLACHSSFIVHRSSFIAHRFRQPTTDYRLRGWHPEEGAAVDLDVVGLNADLEEVVLFGQGNVFIVERAQGLARFHFESG